jgi:hypothetical protein
MGYDSPESMGAGGGVVADAGHMSVWLGRGWIE